MILYLVFFSIILQSSAENKTILTASTLYTLYGPNYKNLTYLDLENNKIDKFDSNALNGMYNLEILYLSNNPVGRF